jgi:hypothetical protein
MAATILTNLTDYTPGVPADEISVNVNRVTLKRANEKIEVRKRQGGYQGRVDHSAKWTGTFMGEFNADFAKDVGSIISIASATYFAINAGGAWIIDDFDFAMENTALVKLNVNATGYDPGDIPAAAVQVPTPTPPNISIPT